MTNPEISPNKKNNKSLRTALVLATGATLLLIGTYIVPVAKGILADNAGFTIAMKGNLSSVNIFKGSDPFLEDMDHFMMKHKGTIDRLSIEYNLPENVLDYQIRKELGRSREVGVFGLGARSEQTMKAGINYVLTMAGYDGD